MRRLKSFAAKLTIVAVVDIDEEKPSGYRSLEESRNPLLPRPGLTILSGAQDFGRPTALRLELLVVRQSGPHRL